MRNTLLILFLSIFLWSCKGSAGSASSGTTSGSSSNSTTSNPTSTQQTQENPNLDQQNTGTNKQGEASPYQKASDVQNTSIKKQYPAAK